MVELRAGVFCLCLLAFARVAEAGDLWVNPIDRVFAAVSVNDEDARPYSVPARPRDIAGAISLSCQNREADPCGDGANGFLDVDTRGGYRDIASGTLRLRGQLGARDAVRVNRVHLDFAYGYVAAEVGRDAIVLGPSARTHLSWGENAPPLDHVRVSTAKPVPLFAGFSADALYAIGQLRGPQRYRHPLVTIGRGELHRGGLTLGIVHLLEVEGEGAPQLGVLEFIEEHFRRKNLTATEEDTSNRRFGGDASWTIPELSLRAYYSLVFEDIRKARWMDALRYDADHLFGLEHPRFIAEYAVTGFRSQEHRPRTSGFTSGGYAVGDPLGPDSRSIYVAARIHRPRYSVLPWLEHARLKSDTYVQVTKGPITPAVQGHREFRYRAGIDGRVALRNDLWAELELRYERVTNFAFVPDDDRNNVGITASVVWYPGTLLRR